MAIVIDGSSLTKVSSALAGNKTYIALVVGMVVIALNHYGLLPESLKPEDLKPENWITDEYKLLVATFVRAGIAKAGSGK